MQKIGVGRGGFVTDVEQLVGVPGLFGQELVYSGRPVHAHIEMPDAHPFTSPLIYAVPVQLMAYHTAVFMGTDVDQPRNLAKSVTVE